MPAIDRMFSTLLFSFGHHCMFVLHLFNYGLTFRLLALFMVRQSCIEKFWKDVCQHKLYLWSYLQVSFIPTRPDQVSSTISFEQLPLQNTVRLIGFENEEMDWMVSANFIQNFTQESSKIDTVFTSVKLTNRYDSHPVYGYLSVKHMRENSERGKHFLAVEVSWNSNSYGACLTSSKSAM